jgi:hypothetical protein
MMTAEALLVDKKSLWWECIIKKIPLSAFAYPNLL